MLQSYQRELVSRYNNIHNKFFPKPEKPKKGKPGNNATGIEAIFYSEIVPVWNWRINLETKPATIIVAGYQKDDSVGCQMILPTIDEIINIVNRDYGYTKAELGGELRTAKIARCRQIICYLILRHTRCSSMTAGIKLNRDHTTVLYGRDRITYLRTIDSELNQQLNRYEAEL